MEMKSNPLYLDAPKETTYEEAMEYQDFVVDLLIERYGIAVSNYSSKSYQYNCGESRQGVEIKLDKRIIPKGNVSIEVFEKTKAENDLWVKSGILRDDNTWLYIQGNYDYIFIFSKKKLRSIYEEEYIDLVWEPKLTIKTFLLPFDKARDICEIFIAVNHGELNLKGNKLNGGVQMEKSESIKEIAMALSKFQGEVYFSSKCVLLSEVINSTKEILTKYGLAVIQAPYTRGDDVIVVTLLVHESGEWLKAPPLSLKIRNQSSQGVGAAIILARRYSLSAILNISSEEDRDCNDIELVQDMESMFDVAGPVESKKGDFNIETKIDAITDRQIKYILTLKKEKEISDDTLINFYKTSYKKESLEDLTKKQGSEVIELLQSFDLTN